MYITVSILIIIVAAVIFGSADARKLEALKQTYHEALKGNDKRLALETGRAYYSALRKGKTLTMYDEQAITNDLSTMS